MNYLEQYKYKHTIQTIYGYSYYEKHKVYLWIINSLWIISVLFACIFREIEFSFLIFLIFILENLFVYLLIKKSGERKILKIIKEG